MMALHAEDNWTERFRPTMDVISEAKEKGLIRAHGCSCHKIEALRLAAPVALGGMILSRITPSALIWMPTPTPSRPLGPGTRQREGIIGMKILGQGDMRTRQDEALKYALSLGILGRFHHWRGRMRPNRMTCCAGFQR